MTTKIENQISNIYQAETKKFFRRAEAATYLSDVHGCCVASATLAKYATVGGGPVFRKIGNAQSSRVIYHRDDLDSWASERMSSPRRHTSEC